MSWRSSKLRKRMRRRLTVRVAQHYDTGGYAEMWVWPWEVGRWEMFGWQREDAS